MPTFNYTFAGNLGSINITTSDNPQPVNPQDGTGRTYSGYPITSVSGTFNGQQVTGLFGSSGAYQSSGPGDVHDNTIFTGPAQGASGSSYDGIDTNGIDFALANGNHVNVFQSTAGASSLIYQTFNGSGNSVNGANVTTITQTNYNALVCYTSGTLIRVLRPGGERDVPVEALQAGDLAVTAAGQHRPIRWVGHRTLDPRRHPRPHEAQPVRVRAGALGEGKPARDLVVSPSHAIALNVLGEVLIPASALVNGTTIVQEDVDCVTYWHVELDSHDLLLAENQPAESYLDMGNRAFFGQDAVIALHAGPDADPARRTHADFCRPFHAAGPLVELLRARLGARAAMLVEDTAGSAMGLQRAG